jgi:hypothetical protein
VAKDAGATVNQVVLAWLIGGQVREADQLIAGALRDIAAEAGLPRSVADAAWRAGRRRRLATLAASAASVAARSR